jgi:hypothetical protein
VQVGKTRSHTCVCARACVRTRAFSSCTSDLSTTCSEIHRKGDIMINRPGVLLLVSLLLLWAACYVVAPYL